LTTNSSGGFQSHVRYKPFGEVRNGYSSAGMVTDKLFTGQEREPVGYVGNIDLFGARFYSPVLGRFISADSIVPGAGNPQSFNRYSFTRNNPLKFVDPTGHAPQPTGLIPPVPGMEPSEDWIFELPGSGSYHDEVVNAVVVELGRVGHNNVTTDRMTNVVPGGAANSSGNVGYADIVDHDSKEIWEVKPDDESHYAKGKEQVDRYASHYQGGTYSAGDPATFPKPTFNFASKSDKTGRTRVYVRVDPSQSGMIYYKVVQTKKQPSQQVIEEITKALLLKLASRDKKPSPDRPPRPPQPAPPQPQPQPSMVPI
jgi:RHS repeat-associated protein